MGLFQNKKVTDETIEKPPKNKTFGHGHVKNH